MSLPFGGLYLGGSGLQAALESKLDRVIAVTRKGQVLPWITPFLKNKKLKVVECKEPAQGQSSSLKAGVKAAQSFGATGIMVLLADQPFVTPCRINQLIEEYQANRNVPFVSFTDKGIPKPPIVFDEKMFPLFMDLQGDKGARALIRQVAKPLGRLIELSEELFFYDVDSIVDYEFVLDRLKPFEGEEGKMWK